MGKREHFARLGKPIVVARPLDDPDENWDDGEDDYPRESARAAMVAAMEALTAGRRTPAPAAPSRTKPVAARQPVRTPHPSQGAGRRPKETGRAPRTIQPLDPKPPNLWGVRQAPPPDARCCARCHVRPGTFYLLGPGFDEIDGTLLCRDDAQGEYLAPELKAFVVTSW